jgi:MOSC domain-containing protein YiiM
MRSIRDLNAPPSIDGRVDAIIVRGASREPARSIGATRAIAGIGLADDRLGTRGEAELSTRQVTLIQAEHLPVIAALARVARVDPVGLRRNLVVSGINLGALKGQRLRVGGALLQIVGPCHPCSRMEDAIGAGGYAAMRGHGGWCARVLDSGDVAVGHAVRVEAATIDASAAPAAGTSGRVASDAGT